jgi:hypothetical protein
VSWRFNGETFTLELEGDSDMSTTTINTIETSSIAGVTIPDSKLVGEATELVRNTESPLLFNHSTRVYYFARLREKRRFEVRSRVALFGRNVPRNGVDSAI